MARRKFESGWTFWVVVSIILLLNIYFFIFVLEYALLKSIGIIIATIITIWILFWVFYKIKDSMFQGYLEAQKNL